MEKHLLDIKVFPTMNQRRCRNGGQRCQRQPVCPVFFMKIIGMDMNMSLSKGLLGRSPLNLIIFNYMHRRSSRCYVR
ncbi:hypothetical protein L6164_002181 [Bauhinia variegata]|uniref:Uncharacterized protein n=1 Tax=Bauhinia variegata TaxID=167791 RepID=A0ACB9PWW0_BAUVA|nr:hypothetical protein L6164_002181 [Bauhinia variegata]